MGVCLSKSGRAEEGIELLRKSAQLTGDDFLDPYHDLAAVLAENGRTAEALDVLETGRKRSEAFCTVTEDFYRFLKTNPPSQTQSQSINQ